MKRIAAMGNGSLKASAQVAPLLTPSYCITQRTPSLSYSFKESCSVQVVAV